MERVWTEQVPEEWGGRSVKNYLRHKLGLSAAAIGRAKRTEGGILLDGVPVFVTAVLRPGSLLSVMLESPSARSETIEPAEAPVNILYEDEDLLIVDKAAGMPVHPSPGHRRDSLGSALLWRYGQLGQPFVFRPVNRLDRGTSGLMAVAKNAAAQERLKKELHTGDFRREYLALVRGAPPVSSGTVDAPIGRKNGSVLMREVRADGAKAVTHYETVRRGEKFTLLRLILETGRTHQIRVHMAYLGCPIVGDFLYGREEPEYIGRTALHSALLELRHPMTGTLLQLESPLPPDMARLTEAETAPAEL